MNSSEQAHTATMLLDVMEKGAFLLANNMYDTRFSDHASNIGEHIHTHTRSPLTSLTHILRELFICFRTCMCFLCCVLQIHFRSQLRRTAGKTRTTSILLFRMKTQSYFGTGAFARFPTSPTLLGRLIYPLVAVRRCFVMRRRFSPLVCPALRPPQTASQAATFLNTITLITS